MPKHSPHESAAALRSALRAAVAGPVLKPDSNETHRMTGYQLERAHGPDMIVVPEAGPDIATTVRIARDHHVPVVAQATGHGRRSGLDGGVLIDLSGLQDLRVDTVTRTAWVGAGVRWQQVTEAAGTNGLAALGGSHPDVSVVGYTLAGGIGALARQYGYAADHVRRVQLVTPDGDTHMIGPDTEPDLFWALRGGIGVVELGIVTGIEIDIVPTRGLQGGSATFEASAALVTGYLDWTSQLSEATTTSLSVMTYPDIPELPDALRNRQLVQVRVLHAGENPPPIEPLLDLAPAVDSSFSPLTFADVHAVFAEPREPHGYLGDERMVHALGDDAVDELLHATGPEAPGPFTVGGIRHLGGALRRQPVNPNVIARSNAEFSVGVLSQIVEPSDRVDAHNRQGSVMAAVEADAAGRSLQFRFGQPVDDEAGRAAFTDAGWQRLNRIASNVSFLHSDD